jgi:hypothetical protein
MTISLKDLLSLATNMNAPSAMLADAKAEISSISREKDVPGGFDHTTVNAEQVGVWIVDLNEFLDRLHRGEITAFDPATSTVADQRTGDLYYIESFRYREARAAVEDRITREDEIHPPAFFLPQHLRGELRALWGSLKDLIPNMINKFQDMAMSYSGDPFQRVSYHSKPDYQEMSGADWLPKWWVPLMYKYEFLDPGMSFDEEVVAALKQTQAKKAEEAEPQKKLELKESRKRRKIRIRLKKRR